MLDRIYFLAANHPMKFTGEQWDALFGHYGDLARDLGISPLTTAAWRHRGRIPVNRVIAVEAVTGVNRSCIRPDIYPVERPKRAKVRA